MDTFKANLDKLKETVAHLYAETEYEGGLSNIKELFLNGVAGTRDASDQFIAEELRALHEDLEEFQTSVKKFGVSNEDATTIWKELNNWRDL
jgi:hypothetical protein